MTIQQHQQRIAAADEKIAATTGVVEANAERISNLDYYNVIGSVTVYFDNGQSTVHAKYTEQLLDLVAQAKTLNAYVVQVQGYASAVGADALNDRLSSERAEAVARYSNKAASAHQPRPARRHGHQPTSGAQQDREGAG